MEEKEGGSMTSAMAKAPVIPIFARPIKPPTPGRPGYKWTAAQRRKFKATAVRRRKERLRAEKEGGRKGSKGARPIARPRAAQAGRQAARGGSGGSIGPHTEPQEGRKARVAGIERQDAIAFLRAATEGYEGIPTSVCYGLLALRRLLGQIK